MSAISKSVTAYLVIFGIFALFLIGSKPGPLCEPTETSVPLPTETSAPVPSDTPIPSITESPKDNPTPPDPTRTKTRKVKSGDDKGNSVETLPDTGGGKPQSQSLVELIVGFAIGWVVGMSLVLIVVWFYYKRH
jgi:hypothetical protein